MENADQLFGRQIPTIVHICIHSRQSIVIQKYDRRSRIGTAITRTLTYPGTLAIEYYEDSLRMWATGT